MKEHLYKSEKPYYLVLLWGLTTFLASALTQLEASLLPALPGTAELRVMIYWTVLMAVPIAGTIYEYRDLQMRTHLNVVWAVIIGVAVLLNWPGLGMDLPMQYVIYGYYHKWFLLAGIVFAYTAYKLPRPKHSRYLYTGAAVANVAILAGLDTVPLVFEYAYGLAALTQGAPMIVDWYLYNR